MRVEPIDSKNPWTEHVHTDPAGCWLDSGGLHCLFKALGVESRFILPCVLLYSHHVLLVAQLELGAILKG